jgi:integrase
MAIHLLSPREVQVAENGTHSDGGGLFLWVNGQSASWLFRYTSPDGRRREMGLKRAERSSLLAAGDSVKRARKAAAEQADLLDEGVDPLDERKRRRGEAQSKAEAEKAAARAEKATLARVAREYHERVIEPKRTTKHAAQWISSLERNVPESIWNTRVDSVDHVSLFEALAALQARIPVTAARVRQRLELVFDHAEFYKMCNGNPARIVRRRLTDMPKARQPGRFAALPFADVPMFIARLRQQLGTAARALEFAILTTARTGDIRGATWEEIDAERTIWRIPAPRMKGGEEHVVFLSPQARAVLPYMRGQARLHLPVARKYEETHVEHGDADVASKDGRSGPNNGTRSLSRLFLYMGQRNRRGAARCDRGVPRASRTRQDQSSL